MLCDFHVLQKSNKGQNKKMKNGILYGVGVGPGDPELLTLKAVRVIKEADVIGIPSMHVQTCTAFNIVKAVVPEIMEKEVLCVPVPMVNDKDVLEKAYQDGAALICQKLEEGKNIAFLNLGDPTIYGSYMGLHSLVSKQGYECEIVSGVPSFCASAATLEISVAKREESIHIMPGFYTMKEHTLEKQDAKDFETERARLMKAQIMEYLYQNGQIVLMKSAGEIKVMKAVLEEIEEERIAKVFAVCNCGMESEVTYYSAKEIPDDAGYFTTLFIKRKNEREE